MPTKDQMDHVRNEIEDFVGGLEVVRLEGDRVVPASASREGEYLFWDDLIATQRRDAMAIVIDWHGFTEAQKAGVIQRVIDGVEPGSWMDDIDATRGHDRGKEQFREILAGVRCQKYGEFLNDATERALARMQGKEGREL
jgi:hypothetical protein